MPRDYDVIVIGMGLAGLSIAAMLSYKGYKVIGIEKSKDLGGRARTLYKDGFTFDYGIHVVRYGTKGGAGKVLQSIGVEDFNPIKVGATFFEAGRFYKFLGGGLASLLNMEIIRRMDKLRFIRKIIQLWREDINSLYPVSLKQWLTDQQLGDELSKLFTIMSTSMIVCPFINRASIGELFHHIQTVLKKRFAVGYPVGGFNFILTRLTEQIKRTGEIITSTKAEKIIIEKNHVQSVIVDQRELSANNVVVAIPSPQFIELIDTGLITQDYITQCQRITPNCGISIDLGVDTDRYKENRIILTLSPPGMGFWASNIEPKLAPPGKSVFTFLTPIDRKELKDKNMVEQRIKQSENLLDTMFPDILKYAVVRRTIVLDTIDGVELNINQTYPTRPSVQVPNVKGLYLIGDTTRAHGNGGEIAFNSAIECFDLIDSKK